MLTPIKKVSLTDSIIRQLLSYIQTDLELGEKLPSERKLIDMLGVGRTSLRESLRALEMLGAVVTKPGEGTFVTMNQGDYLKKPLELGVFNNQRSIQEIYEARFVLEIGMVPFVLKSITNDELKQLDIILKKMKEIDIHDLDKFLAYDQQFHRIIAASTRNGIIIEVLKLTHRILEEERKIAKISTEDLKKSVSLHEEVLLAINTGNSTEVETAIRDHMKWTGELLQLDII